MSATIAPRQSAYSRTGGPEVMEYVDVEVAPPGPGEARVRHEAIGLNFIDVYFRTGLYPQPLPAGLGLEGAGVVEAVGEGVTEVKVGDRVAYAARANGAYAQQRNMPAAAAAGAARAHRFRHGGRHDAAGPDGAIPVPPHGAS